MRRRYERFSELILLVALLVASQPVIAQSLQARVDGERLRVGVSRLRLLTGVPLERLHDGATVIYTFQLSILNGRSGEVVSRTFFRFAISFDIFEETFQVSRLEPTTRVQSHLSMMAAEAAVVDAIEMSTRSLPADRPFWIRLDYRTEDMTQSGDTPISIGTLVDLFSRKSSRSPVSGGIDAGPFRLQDLPRVTPTRGAPNP